MLILSLKSFFRNPALMPQVLASLVFDFYLLFLPILLFEFFQSQSMTAIGYAFIYGVSSILLHSKKLSKPLCVYAGVIALSSAFSLFYPALYGYGLALSAMLGVTIRDAQQSFYHEHLSQVSHNQKMFGILTLFSLLLIPIFTNTLNIALSFSTKGDISISLVSQVILASLLMMVLMRIKKPHPIAVDVADQPGLTKNIKLICWYSALYNATAFPIRMIIVPMIIYGATKEMGYSDQALSITGSIIGSIAILGTLLRFLIPNASIDTVLLMNRYHQVGILTMMGIVIIAMGIDQSFWSKEALPWVVFVVVCLQLSLEVTAKIWSVGFIGTLRALTTKSSRASSTYRAAYLHFMAMKNLGSCVGFLLFGASAWVFSGPYNVFLTGVAAILLVIATTKGVRRELESAGVRQEPAPGI